MEMEKFSEFVKTAAVVIGAVGGGALAAKGMWEGSAFMNDVVKHSDFLAYWFNVVPEGQVIVKSAVAGLMGAGLGALGTKRAVDAAFPEKPKLKNCWR